MGIKDKVAIIGMGCTKFGENWSSSAYDMIIDAAHEAFEDAGITPSQIQAAWVGTLHSGASGTCLAEPLKFQHIPVSRVENLCASGMDALRNACFAVACGEYEIALVLGFEKLKDSGLRGLPESGGRHPLIGTGRTAPGNFALAANRYFYKYGLSTEQGKEALAKIAVKNHHNGSLNSKAHFQRDITIEQAIEAPMIAMPLGLLDCCPVTDGAAAAIIARTELAKEFRDDYIKIKAIALSVAPGMPHFRPGFDYVGFKATQVACEMAYKKVGIKNPLKEIHIAEVHDCFTITELLNYEDLGFCEKGTAKEYIDGGVFNLGGDLPVNTDGGLQAFGHPIGASGLRMIYEVYKQLQGNAGLRQVKDPELGLAHNLGGTPSVSTVAILGN